MTDTLIPTETLPKKVKVAEASRAELQEGSGVFDGDRELTNLQAILLFERGVHGAQDVFTSDQGLSEEAQQHNSNVTRTSGVRGPGPAEHYRQAVYSHRPPVSLHR